jgi:hypothetical protein
MSRKAIITGWLLLGFYLALAGNAAFSTPDFSWSPSYFDDDDDDFLPLLTERMPVLIVAVVPVLAIMDALTTAVLLRPSTHPLLAPPRSRLRAPPLS